MDYTKNSIARVGDFKTGYAMQLIKSDDGNITAGIICEGDSFSPDSIEIKPLQSRSPRTQKALLNLFEAMVADELESPDNTGARYNEKKL